MSAAARTNRMLHASVAAMLDQLWESDTRPAMPSLADELTREYGRTKAEALAMAYERFCSHKNRDRFNAEVRAIKGCSMADVVGVNLTGDVL